MLKIIIDFNSDSEKVIEAGGNVIEIMSDLQFAIGDIFHALKGSNPAVAEAFRSGMAGISCPDHPIWRMDFSRENGSLTVVSAVIPKKGGPDHG